jgi:hypothetical protein
MKNHTPEDVKKIESKWDLNIWEKALGWRKRQMIMKQLDPVSNKIRNDTLEEVAKEFDKMKPFGDTAQGFATYVRMMKK